MEQALVFASIIVGVAISDQIVSLHRLLRGGAPVKWHWAQPWFALLVLLLNVMIWWSVASQDAASLSIAQFLPTLVQLILLALLTIATLPDRISPEGVDLAEFYQDNRRYQWSLLAVALSWTLIIATIERTANGEAALAVLGDRVGDLVVLAIMVALAFIRRWWIVGLGMALLSTGPLNWLSRTIG